MPNVAQSAWGRWIFYGLGNYLFGPVSAQIIGADGAVSFAEQPLTLANRQSLALAFDIVPDKGSGRLRLQKIQPIVFDETWQHRPIELSDLTFDISRANTQLARFTRKNQEFVFGRNEAFYRCCMRNGVMSYFYPEPDFLSGGRGLARRMLSRILRPRRQHNADAAQ